MRPTLTLSPEDFPVSLATKIGEDIVTASGLTNSLLGADDKAGGGHSS